MKIKHATIRFNEIQAHNKRIDHIRNKSLSHAAVDSIDCLMQQASTMLETIHECLWNGVSPNFSTEDIVDMRQAMARVSQHFDYQEVSEFLLERVRQEAEEDDE